MMVEQPPMDTVISMLITVLVYMFTLYLYNRTARPALLHPIVMSVSILLIVLSWVGMPVQTYQQHTQWLSWLLAPATIALAVPLYKHLRQIIHDSPRLFLPIVIGGMVAPILAWGILFSFDSAWPITLSMLTKSITTPLAMETAAIIGGYPALAAVIVVFTGIVAAVLAEPVFRQLPELNDRDKGIALGTVGHAIGTATAAQKSPQCAAFATLSLCLNGILTALLLPLLVYLFGQ